MLIEREEYLRQFRGRLDSLAEGSGGTVVLNGPVASGRTRLLREFLADVAERSTPGRALAGSLVLSATGSPASKHLPFGLLAQLLGSITLPLDLRREVEVITSSAVELAPGPATTGLVHRIAESTLALAADRPVVIVVDDVQDGDELSLECLVHLARRLVATRMLLVLAVRTGTADSGRCHVYGHLLHEGIGSGMRLSPLSERGVAALAVERLGRATADRVAAACFAVTGGNCLLVNAVLEDHAAVIGGLPLQRDNRLVPGEAYGRAVLACLDRGDEVARRAAEVLAVIGGARSPAMLAALVGVDERVVVDAVEALESIGLLDRGRFRHPLAREALLARLSADECAEVHLRAAAHVQRQEGPVDEVVDHFLAADRVGDQGAVSLLQCVAERMLIVDDVDRALRCLRLAAEHCVDQRQRATIISRLVSVVWRSSTVAVAQQYLPALVEALHEGTLPDTQVPAVLRYLLWHGDMDEAGAVVARLYAEHDGGPVTEEVESLEWWLRHTYPSMAEHIPPHPRVPPAPVRTTPDTTAAGRVIAAKLVSSVLVGDDSDEVVIGAQQVLQSCPLGEDTIETLVTALIALVHVDRLDLARPWCDELIARAGERRAPTWEAVLTAVRADIALREGDLGETVRCGYAALETMPAHSWGTNIGHVRASLIVAHTCMDEFEKAAEQVRQPLPDSMFESRFGLHYLFARGQYYLAVDRPYAALSDFWACGELLVKWDMDVPSIAPWRSEAAQCHLALGQHDRARELAEEQLARIPRHTSRAAGLAMRVLAATAPPAERVGLLEAAAEVFTRCGARFHLARTLLDLGNTHHDLGDDAKARIAIRQTQRIAKECRAKRLQREVPHQRAAWVSEDTSSEGQTGEELSDAENRVATLASLGYTNRQIADKLYVTISTVEQHLTRTYRKLGITRRSDIAIALRLQAV